MGFPGMNFLEDTSSILKPFIDKMELGQLTLEDILNEDNIIQDIKSNNESKFINFLTKEKIQKLIDYSTKFPAQDDPKIGYKYPFNATEILCSDNINFQNNFMEQKPYIIDEKENAKEFIKRIKKGGFFEQLFKSIRNIKNGINNFQIENDGEENDDDYEDEEDDDDDDDENKEDKNKENKLPIEKSENKKVIYENVDYLLNFLKEANETKENYVLVGYFYKILNSLINIHQMKIVQYLLDYPKKEEFDITTLLIKHMNRKSMGNIVQKLLMFDDELITKYEEKKLDLLAQIFEEMNISEEKNKYECISECICCVMNNRQFFDLFMTKSELLEKIYNILFNSKNDYKYNSIMKLLLKINENILQHFSIHYTENTNEPTNDLPLNIDTCVSVDKSLSSPEDNVDILKKYLIALFDILEKNKFEFLNDLGNISQHNIEFLSTYMEKQKKIGIKKILQTEYLKTLIDIFVNSYASKYHENKINDLIKIGGEKNIFWSLHDLFLNFPFSNVFQIYYNQIMKIVINENSPNSLIDAFFNESKEKKRNLIELYINKIFSDIKFIFKLTNTPSFNPLFSYIITILNKIFGSQNLYIKKIIENNKDISVFHEIIGQEIESIFNQKLLLLDNNNNFGNFGFDNVEETPLPTFGPKNFLEIFEENCKIYEMYKKGEDYKKALEEKKERIEKEKQLEKKENKMEKNGLEYIDDFEEEDDPLFKVEKINLKKEKEDFLALLNKPREEINFDEDNKDVIIDNIENDGHIGRFKELWDDDEEKDENKKEDIPSNSNENKSNNKENKE